MKNLFFYLFFFLAPLSFAKTKAKKQTPPPIPKAPQEIEKKSVEIHSDLNREPAAFYSASEWYKRCSAEIDARIFKKDAALTKAWRDDTSYLKSSWAYGLNLTAVAMAKGAPRAVAITPKHLVSTKHYGWHPSKGQTVRFLTMDNRIISRVVDQVVYLGSPNNTVIDTDVAVIRLNEDLPGSISPMKLVALSGAVDVSQWNCPVLRIDQENKALLVGNYATSASSTSASFFEPTANSSQLTVRSYAPFYESMVTGDSTSSSILIYRDQFGVTPFLWSQVTFAGPGSGPRHSTFASQIQGVIDGFGDTQGLYKIKFGPYEFAGHSAPTCTITATRIGNSSSCSISVEGSGDSTTGNPTLLPSSPSSWTRSGNIWNGSAQCSTESATTFNAQLTGPGGTGRACESAEIKPLILLPGCNLTASRQGTSSNCSVSVTRTQGSVNGNPSFSPVAPLSWTKTIDTWNGSVTCSQSATTQFSAQLSGPNGTGPACTASVAAVPPPSCTLTAARAGASSICNLTLSAGGSTSTSTSPVFNVAVSGNWTGSNWVGTASCATTASTSFTATVKGFSDATATCHSSAVAPVPIPKPTCSITASREGSTSNCNVEVKRVDGVASGNPVVAPTNPSSWITSVDTWTGKTTCSLTSATTFTASLSGPGGTGPTCTATPVPAQNVAPSCSMSVRRNNSNGICTVTLNVSGQVSRAPTLKPTPLGKWTNTGSTWSNTANCKAKGTYSFNATVTGPYGQGYCGGGLGVR